MLEAILNQSRVHKEHERFYSSSPLETALRLQRYAHPAGAGRPLDHRRAVQPQGAEPL
jgi:hypothetical protein